MLAEEIEDKEASRQAITNYSSSVLKLTMRMNEESIRIRNEANSLKLIAPSDILSLINELDVLLEQSFDASMEVVKGMLTVDLLGNSESLNPQKKKAEELGQKVREKHQELMQIMRDHLDSI